MKKLMRRTIKIGAVISLIIISVFSVSLINREAVEADASYTTLGDPSKDYYTLEITPEYGYNLYANTPMAGSSVPTKERQYWYREGYNGFVIKNLDTQVIYGTTYFSTKNPIIKTDVKKIDTYHAEVSYTSSDNTFDVIENISLNNAEVDTTYTIINRTEKDLNYDFYFGGDSYVGGNDVSYGSYRSDPTNGNTCITYLDYNNNANNPRSGANNTYEINQDMMSLSGTGSTPASFAEEGNYSYLRGKVARGESLVNGYLVEGNATQTTGASMSTDSGMYIQYSSQKAVANGSNSISSVLNVNRTNFTLTDQNTNKEFKNPVSENVATFNFEVNNLDNAPTQISWEVASDFGIYYDVTPSQVSPKQAANISVSGIYPTNIQTGKDIVHIKMYTAGFADPIIFDYQVDILRDRFNITKTSENGEIQLSSNDVEFNSSVSATMVPNEGYELDKVLVNGVDKPVNNNQLVLSEIRENKEIVASFKKIIYQIDVNHNEGGSVVIDHSRVEYLGSSAVTIIPNLGYEIDKIMLDGRAYPSTSNKIILDSIKSNHQIEVTFKKGQGQFISETVKIDPNATTKVETNNTNNIKVDPKTDDKDNKKQATVTFMGNNKNKTAKSDKYKTYHYDAQGNLIDNKASGNGSENNNDSGLSAPIRWTIFAIASGILIASLGINHHKNKRIRKY